MPTTDFSTSRHISRVREVVQSSGVGKSGGPVASSTIISRRLGTVKNLTRTLSGVHK